MNGFRWMSLRLAVWLSETFPCAVTTRFRQSRIGRCMRTPWE